MVAPSTSTASCLPVNGRNGVGIRILFAITPIPSSAFFCCLLRRAGPPCPAPLRVHFFVAGAPPPLPPLRLRGPVPRAATRPFLCRGGPSPAPDASLAGPPCPAPLRVDKRCLAELRAIVGQPPHSHQLRLALFNRHDDIPE